MREEPEVLEDHADLLRAEGPKLGGGEGADVYAVDHNLS
jgi:hypothetical protein